MKLIDKINVTIAVNVLHSCNKKLSVLLRRITSKHHGGFYCPNCLYSFATENTCKSHKIGCENKDFCNFIFPSEGNKTLEFNHYQKSDKSFIQILNAYCEN